MTALAYLVSSHFSYAPLALPILLPSMRAAGIPREQIFVVMCGCVREFDMLGPDCMFWFVNHESRNFCTFVEAVNPARQEALSAFDHVFCLLDTCKAGPKFKTLSENFDRNLDACGAYPHYHYKVAQSDLASYSLAHLHSQKPLIDSVYKNVTPDNNLDYEGRMFGLAEKKAFYGTEISEAAPPGDVYGTGTRRLTENYLSVDLYHYKSNWGQNGRRLLDRI